MAKPSPALRANSATPRTATTSASTTRAAKRRPNASPTSIPVPRTATGGAKPAAGTWAYGAVASGDGGGGRLSPDGERPASAPAVHAWGGDAGAWTGRAAGDRGTAPGATGAPIAEARDDPRACRRVWAAG